MSPGSPSTPSRHNWAEQVREKALARAMDPEELEMVEKEVEETLAGRDL